MYELKWREKEEKGNAEKGGGSGECVCERVGVGRWPCWLVRLLVE